MKGKKQGTMVAMKFNRVNRHGHALPVLKNVLDVFQTEVIVTRWYKYTPPIHGRDHFHCICSRMSKDKKYFV